MKIVLLISTLFPSLILSASLRPLSKTAKPIVIPLQQRNLYNTNIHQSVSSKDLDDAKRKTNFKRNENILDWPLSNDLQRRTLPNDILNSKYVGTLMVGTPPKPFFITFETTSFDILLPFFKCKVCSSASLYDPSQSSSSQDLKKHFEALLKYKGNVYSDYISFNGFNLSKQTFGAYDTTMNLDLLSVPSTGIFGLAPTTYTNLGGIHFIQNLFLHGVIPTLNFGIYFDRMNQNDSHFILGGYNKTLAGTPNYNKVIQGNYWVINFDSIKLKNNEILRLSHGALIDTGNSSIIGPLKDIEVLYKSIPNWEYDYDFHYEPGGTTARHFTFSCSVEDNLPEFTFVFNNVEYPIMQNDLIYSHLTLDPNRCTGTLAGNINPGGPIIPWTLGIPFLRNVYTVFDLAGSQIGFTSISTFTSDM